MSYIRIPVRDPGVERRTRVKRSDLRGYIGMEHVEEGGKSQPQESAGKRRGGMNKV
jgi:hypothetical protein